MASWSHTSLILQYTMPQPEYTWAERRESPWHRLMPISWAAVLSVDEMEGCPRLTSSPSWFPSNLKTLSWHKSKSDKESFLQGLGDRLNMVSQSFPSEHQARSLSSHYREIEVRRVIELLELSWILVLPQAIQYDTKCCCSPLLHFTLTTVKEQNPIKHTLISRDTTSQDRNAICIFLIHFLLDQLFLDDTSVWKKCNSIF